MVIPFGVNSMIEPLRHVLVQAPTETFGQGFEDAAHGYRRPVDLATARREHDALCALLSDLGATVHALNGESASPDLIYTYDASLVTRAGVILLRSGKATRRGEEHVHRAWYEQAGIPIVGTIEAPGTVDGGDVLWLRHDLVIVGRSLRTNQAGIDQLLILLDERVSVFDVPVHNGTSECLHIMSSISLVDDRLALVESRLLASGLYRLLDQLEVELVEAPPSEIDSLAVNLLTIRPGVVVAVEGNPMTRSTLEARGVEVHTFKGSEIAINGTGGPTCLTRPIHRA